MTRDREATARRQPGRLAVYCWCQRRILHVPTDEIWHGRTASCGHEECHP
jgi:hypothetical protein